MRTGKEAQTLKSVRGVAINRLDLISVPVPSARLLWRDLQVRDPQNVRIDIIVEGVTDRRAWKCGFGI